MTSRVQKEDALKEEEKEELKAPIITIEQNHHPKSLPRTNQPQNPGNKHHFHHNKPVYYPNDVRGNNPDYVNKQWSSGHTDLQPEYLDMWLGFKTNTGIIYR